MLTPTDLFEVESPEDFEELIELLFQGNYNRSHDIHNKKTWKDYLANYCMPRLPNNASSSEFYRGGTSLPNNFCILPRRRPIELFQIKEDMWKLITPYLLGQSLFKRYGDKHLARDNCLSLHWKHILIPFLDLIHEVADPNHTTLEVHLYNRSAVIAMDPSWSKPRVNIDFRKDDGSSCDLEPVYMSNLYIRDIHLNRWDISSRVFNEFHKLCPDWTVYSDSFRPKYPIPFNADTYKLLLDTYKDFWK